jgi:hypothetical protein
VPWETGDCNCELIASSAPTNTCCRRDNSCRQDRLSLLRVLSSFLPAHIPDEHIYTYPALCPAAREPDDRDEYGVALVLDAQGAWLSMVLHSELLIGTTLRDVLSEGISSYVRLTRCSLLVYMPLPFALPKLPRELFMSGCVRNTTIGAVQLWHDLVPTARFQNGRDGHGHTPLTKHELIFVCLRDISIVHKVICSNTGVESTMAQRTIRLF